MASEKVARPSWYQLERKTKVLDVLLLLRPERIWSLRQVWWAVRDYYQIDVLNLWRHEPLEKAGEPRRKKGRETKVDWQL